MKLTFNSGLSGRVLAFYATHIPTSDYEHAYVIVERDDLPSDHPTRFSTNSIYTFDNGETWSAEAGEYDLTEVQARNDWLSRTGLDGKLTLEILHNRHPDMGCEVNLYVQGHERKPSAYLSVDPGAGHVRAEWDNETAAIRNCEAYSEAFRFDAAAERDEARDSEYVTDEG